MHGAFTYVIWIVVGVGVVVAVVAAASSGKVWEQIGRDGMVRDRERTSGTSAGSGFGSGTGGGLSAAGLAERDIEIRQMLQARNDRRARRGEPPLDVESELRRLTAPAVDDEVRDEIRQLVVARNHRRARRGEPPLDVESEVERRVAELSSSYSRPTSS
jgi:hypothetical protein